MRRIGLMIVDLSIIWCGVIAAVLLRGDLTFSADTFSQYLNYFVATIVVSVVLLATVHLHRSSWRFVSMPDFLRLVAATGLIVLGAVIVTFAFDRLNGVARSVPLIQFGLTAAMLISVRLAYRDYRARRSGQLSPTPSTPLRSAQQVLVVGINPIADLYVNCVRTYAANSTVVAGIISDKSRVSDGRTVFGLPVLGGIVDLDRVVSELEVHGIFLSRIVVASDPNSLHQSQLDHLEQLALRSALEIDYLAHRRNFAEFGEALNSGTARHGSVSRDTPDVAAFACEEVVASQRSGYWLAKRAFDVLGALLLLIVFAVPMAAIAAVVGTWIGMPVVFWQYRPGRDGKEFRLYKFRTMLRPMTSDGHRIPDRDRHSRVGSVLRQYRLDELPQLVNILKGDMSFVGPRPLLLSEQTGYPAARAQIRPGLTGWAQVNGGRIVSASDKVALDLWYIKNAGLKVDIQVFVKTLRMIVRGDEAHPEAISLAWREVGARGLGGSPAR